jgi:hypothetical protein
VRQAPPVSLRCDGSAAWQWLHALLAAAAVASFVSWALLHAGAEATTAVAASVAFALLAGVAAWRGARRDSAELQWDGQCWSLDGAAGRVDVMMDLGPWLLLRFQPTAGAAHWLPVPGAAPARHGLRAALYSRAGASAPGVPAVPVVRAPGD